MLATITVTESLPASAELAWAAIRAIGGLDRWFPIIDQCLVDGEGIGATRKLVLAEGGYMLDVVELLDDAAKRFGYHRIELPFPVTDYHGTVAISAIDQHRSQIIWTVVFIMATSDDALQDFIRQALTDGIQGLANELQAANQGGQS
jgi:Polyketide cyclase / dehydrase and lipid transport.